MDKNDLELSSDLNVITAEINSYKQVAGQAIFEIGRRLKHVKENDLVHGEFGKWLESIDMTSRHAQRFIKVYEELPNTTSVSHLGVKALYEIATLPQEEREKEHTTSKGETKKVDEMTVRELQEIKRKNKELEQSKQQAESQAESERKERERLENELNNQEPKIKEIVKEVEIDNTDYERVKLLEKEKQQQEVNNEKLQEKIGELDGERKRLEELVNSDNFKLEEKKKEEEAKRIEAHISIYSLQTVIHKFVRDASPDVFLQGAVASSSYKIKDDLLDSIISLEELTKKLREVVGAEISNEAEIIEIKENS